MFGGHVDPRIRAEEIAEEIMLLLSVITLLRPTTAKKITIRSARRDDPNILRHDANLQAVQERIDALRKQLGQ